MKLYASIEIVSILQISLTTHLKWFGLHARGK